MRCPRCGQGDYLYVTIPAGFRVTESGPELVDDVTWDDGAATGCACGWRGEWADCCAGDPICPNCKNHSLQKTDSGLWCRVCDEETE